MRVPLVRGNYLSGRERAGSPGAAVVNETFARKFFSDESPIGQQITLRIGRSGYLGGVIEDRPREIIGVVGDVRQVGYKRESEPTLYVHYQQNLRRGMTLAVRGDAPP